MSGLVGDNLARASGVIASAGGGTILSVKSMKVTSTVSNSGTAPTQISAFDMSFAPTTSDGKLYFQLCTNVCGSGDGPTAGYFYDVTNSAQIGAFADTGGSRLRCSWGGNIRGTYYYQNVNFGTWHEPGTTNSIDYAVFGNNHSSTTMYINRTGTDANNAGIEVARTASTFTITEYAASAVTLT